MSLSIVLSYAGANPPRLPVVAVIAGNFVALMLLTVLITKRFLLAAGLLSLLLLAFALLLLAGE